MSMTEKFSGLDFLNAVEAKEGDGKNRKAAIFNALFKALSWKPLNAPSLYPVMSGKNNS